MNNSKISFYSGYSYLRPMIYGSISSTLNAFGAHSVNATIPIPVTIKTLPPVVAYYFEYPTGTIKPIGKTGGVSAGNDSTTIYVEGYDSGLPYDAAFKVRYVIYERKI